MDKTCQQITDQATCWNKFNDLYFLRKTSFTIYFFCKKQVLLSLFFAKNKFFM
jgi:hypothetical protein